MLTFIRISFQSEFLNFYCFLFYTTKIIIINFEAGQGGNDQYLDGYFQYHIM